jgi:mannosyltransferase
MSGSTARDRVLPPPGPWRTGWILAVIVAVAAGIRGYQLGRLSFWYDEVVTMRLARAGSPAALIDRLFRIDATRAPLHPLLLEGWIGIFGTSEAAARASSVLCGVLTVVVVFDIGRAAVDVRTGLWASWLTAVCPALIVYAREARMYAWLVLVACLCWRLLLDLRRSFTSGKAVAYVIALAALVYSHPLGLPMLATLALAGLIGVHTCFGSRWQWLAVHVAAGALVAPWVPRYLDHPPELLSGPLSIRFLVGTPIGFTGGNFAILGGLALLIAWGVADLCRVGYAHRSQALAGGQIPPYASPLESLTAVFLLLWLIVPPLVLYVYSRLFQPIFGPQRYTVYVAPAYLLLVALGLARLPAAFRYPLAIGLSIQSASELGPKVYDAELKADWRGFASVLAGRPAASRLVIVIPSSAGRNVEVETARYYLPAGCEAIALDEATSERLAGARAEEVYLAVGLRRGVPAVPPPERIGAYMFRPDRDYPGLMTLRAEHRSARGGLGRRDGSTSGMGGRRGILGCTTGVIAFGGGLEHRKHQAIEIPSEVRPGGAEGLLCGGADAKAPLLQLGRNRAESESLDDGESSLDLGVPRQIAAFVGLEIVGPDGRGPRAVRDPSPSRRADPEGRLDRDAAEIGRDREPGHHGADAPPARDRLELLRQRIGPALGPDRVEQPLQL